MTESGETEAGMDDWDRVMVCSAVPSSVHKMAVEGRCYGNAPVKLPLHPQAISIISPPTNITPFPSGSAERRMSVCHVGQRGSVAALWSAQTDRPGWCRRGQKREGGSNVEVGKKIK